MADVPDGFEQSNTVGAGSPYHPWIEMFDATGESIFGAIESIAAPVKP